jgi:hypothetical protein
MSSKLFYMWFLVHNKWTHTAVSIKFLPLCCFFYLHQKHAPTHQITFSDDLKKVKNGEMDIEKMCIGCKSSNTKIVGQHPYFKGALCKTCMVRDILFVLYESILTSFYDIFMKVWLACIPEMLFIYIIEQSLHLCTLLKFIKVQKWTKYPHVSDNLFFYKW